MDVKIPGLKYNKPINEQLDIFENHLNKYGSMLLELQRLNESQEKFIKYLTEEINKDKPLYKAIWQNKNENRCEQINNDEIIMRPAYITLEKTLKKYIEIYNLEIIKKEDDSNGQRRL